MAQLLPAESQRVVDGLPFVEALARRLAASMPHSIDIGDLVQDGVLGLIDAADRFDEDRGIKFETFAERRVHETEHAILDQVPDVDRVRHRRREPASEGLDERKAGDHAAALGGGKGMGLHRISLGVRGVRRSPLMCLLDSEPGSSFDSPSHSQRQCQNGTPWKPNRSERPTLR